MTRARPDLLRERAALRSITPVIRKTQTTLAAGAPLVLSWAAPSQSGDLSEAAGK